MFNIYFIQQILLGTLRFWALRGAGHWVEVRGTKMKISRKSSVL